MLCLVLRETQEGFIMTPIRNQVTISGFRDKITEYTKDTTGEVLLTRSGRLVGVYVGISAWDAMQETLQLMNNPELLMRSLMKHREFQKTGKAEGVSLEELRASLEQGNVDAGAV